MQRRRHLSLDSEAEQADSFLAAHSIVAMAFAKVALGLAALVGVAAAAPQLGFNEDPEFLRAQRLGEPFDVNPAYTYSYQVADDAEQTYIAKEESRDGDDTVGQYQYVDANGALIRVEYRAGPMGYTEERFVEPNFVVVRARPQVSRTVTTSSNNANSGFVSGVVRQVTPAVQRVVTTSTSSSSENDSDLVARIVAQLTPFIRRTVSDSLTSGQTTTTTRRVQAVQQPVQAVRRVVTTTNAAPAVTATTTRQIFGTGGANNIRFENPDINYAFDLQ